MPRPNILIIVVDDLGVDVLRVANGEVTAEIGVPAIAKSAGPLPTLGKLLKSGIHFSTAWAQPVCSPTRASLFTGLNPWKTEVGYPGTRPLPLQDATEARAPMPMLAKTLKAQAGYRCAMFGKWDLGGAELLGGQTPLEWGWDRFEGIYGGGVRPVGVTHYGLSAATTRVTIDHMCNYSNPDTHEKRNVVAAQVKSYLERVCEPRFVDGQPDLRYYIWEKNIDDLATNTKQVDVSPFKRKHLYATADQVDSAKEWIKQSAGQPWCVALTILAPHDPLHVPPKESYKIQLSDVPSVQQMLIAMIESMDYYLGQLLNAPEIQDQLKNTVIIFAGDNGTQDRDVDSGIQIDGIAGDDKNSHRIGGVHVPMIVADGGVYFNGPPCWLKDSAGNSTAGTTSNGLVHIMDVHRTALEIAGATPTSPIDSQSLNVHLQKTGTARSYLFSQQYPLEDVSYSRVSKNASVSDGEYKLSCYRSTYVDGGAGDVFTYEFSKLVPEPGIPGSQQEELIQLDEPAHQTRIKAFYEQMVTQRLDSGEGARGPLPFPPLPVSKYRYVRLLAKSEVNGNPWTSMADFQIISEGKVLSRVGWVVSVDSQETAGENGAGANVLDAATNTIWHTQWSRANPPHPHWLAVDIQTPQVISGFKYLPRQDVANGRIAAYEFQVSKDGFTWGTIASGVFTNSAAEETVLVDPPATGTKIALRADTGNYLTRCNGCYRGAAYPDSATMHITQAVLASSPYAHWTLEKLANGKYALRTDTGNYLARCNGGIPNAAHPDSAMVHVSGAQLKDSPWAQWTIEKLGNGKFALRGDNGNYLARCYGCVPGAAYPDGAFLHIGKDQVNAAPYAQWTFVLV